MKACKKEGERKREIQGAEKERRGRERERDRYKYRGFWKEKEEGTERNRGDQRKIKRERGDRG